MQEWIPARWTMLPSLRRHRRCRLCGRQHPVPDGSGYEIDEAKVNY
jgi:hypothetical protein